jgi:hypothetical protein
MSLTQKGEELLRTAFAFFDKSGSGALGVEEFRALLLEAASEGANPLTEEEVTRTFLLVDKNRNGLIEVDEYVAWWRKRKAADPIDTKLKPLADEAELQAIVRRLTHELSAEGGAHEKEKEEMTVLQMVDTLLSSRDNAIADKDSALADNERALADNERALAEKDRALADKDLTIGEQRQVIDDKDHTIAELLKEKERLLEEKDHLMGQVRLLFAPRLGFGVGRFRVVASRRGR